MAESEAAATRQTIDQSLENTGSLLASVQAINPSISDTSASASTSEVTTHALGVNIGKKVMSTHTYYSGASASRPLPPSSNHHKCTQLQSSGNEAILTTGQIIGIAAGGAAVALAITLAIVLITRRHRVSGSVHG